MITHVLSEQGHPLRARATGGVQVEHEAGPGDVVGVRVDVSVRPDQPEFLNTEADESELVFDLVGTLRQHSRHLERSNES